MLVDATYEIVCRGVSADANCAGVTWREGDQTMKNLMNFLVGAVLGALVGAVAALLLAPESGSELRTQLRGEVDDILAEGRRAARQRRSELEEQLTQMRRS
jgi:hypothetical protein